MMPLPAMSLELSFCASREGRWMDAPKDLAVESPWSALGRPFLSSFAQMGSRNSHSWR